MDQRRSQKEIRKCLELKDHRAGTWDVAKEDPREKFIALNTFNRKEDMS
jgi:hypothetical protein